MNFPLHRFKLATPKTDTLLPAITRLLQDMLQILSDKREYSDEEYLECARKSPVIRPALTALSLLVVNEFGDYVHEDEKIQDFIRKQFEQMRGSLALSIEEMVSFYPLGRAVSQWGIENRDGQWSLIDIQILDPKNYEFMGRVGNIEKLRVYVGGTESYKEVPFGGEDGRFLHLINGRNLAFRDPDGIPALDSVMASWQAWKILLSEMCVAGQRQATPLLVGYAPTAVRVPTGEVDSDGNEVTVSAVEALLWQLELTDNRSVLSTDIENRIEAISSQAGAEFFVAALGYLQQIQLLGLCMPESILTATGVGDSNLNAGQRDTLGQLVKSLANQIKEVLLEQVVRKLITWNFGDQDSYGEFPSPEVDSTDKIALFNALVGAITAGAFSAADLDLINKLREIATLPEMQQGDLQQLVQQEQQLLGGQDQTQAPPPTLDQAGTMDTPPPDQQAQAPTLDQVSGSFALDEMVDGWAADVFSAVKDGTFDAAIAAELLDIVRTVNDQMDQITDYDVGDDDVITCIGVDGPRQFLIRIDPDGGEIQTKVLNWQQLQGVAG